MTDPLVSIIIPVYNSAQYLDETIQSALNQTWARKEVIVVDNNSTDNSLGIAEQFSPEVRVFTEPRQGASAARNKGLAEAKGDLIQFLDADDLLEKNKIALQVAMLKDKRGVLAYGEYCSFYDRDDMNEQNTGSHISGDYQSGRDLLFDLYGGRDNNFQGGMMPQHSWLVPRSVIDQAGAWDTSLTIDDDGEFFCRVTLAAKEIKFVSNSICYYRKHRHSKSLSAQKSYPAFLSAFKAIKLKHQHIGDDPGINPLLANQAMHLLSELYPDHPELCREIQRFIKKAGGNTWQPYQEGLHKPLRAVFGWKTVKLLSYYRNKLAR